MGAILTALILGGLAGALLALCLLVGVFLWCLRPLGWLILGSAAILLALIA